MLVIQVKRSPEVVEIGEDDNITCAKKLANIEQERLLRYPVAVEEQLTIEGVDMDLVGVVYHNGKTIQSGHYNCLCRGPGGRFWYLMTTIPC